MLTARQGQVPKDFVFQLVVTLSWSPVGPLLPQFPMEGKHSSTVL